jgi:UDP-3-O-[3-hydroxymyristoyl] glucosamine N-acyltransferase|tara:strand:- start:10204 stop:11205 length:1002 start_codon:yes stop_codon:yes gene_type:complete
LQLSLSEIALLVKGDVSGDPDLKISGVSEIQNGKPGTITFLGNPLYGKYLDNTAASAVFVSKKTDLKDHDGIIVTDPQLAMAKTLSVFYPDKKPPGIIHPNTFIHHHAKVGVDVTIDPGTVIESGAIIGDGSWIGPNVFIGANISMGTNCKIYANTVLYHDIVMGDKVIIHAGAVIGSDGYGFVNDSNRQVKIPQVGSVLIGDNVEIGSNSTIDRATIGNTIIGDMCKLDNLVHIAHNVKIGRGCLITAQVGIAGSAEVGDFCTFAGQAGVVPHVRIGDNSIITGKSGVTKSLSGNEIYGGFPARPIKEQHKKDAILIEVSRMRKQLDQLIKG